MGILKRERMHNKNASTENTKRKQINNQRRRWQKNTDEQYVCVNEAICYFMPVVLTFRLIYFPLRTASESMFWSRVYSAHPIRHAIHLMLSTAVGRKICWSHGNEDWVCTVCPFTWSSLKPVSRWPSSLFQALHASTLVQLIGAYHFAICIMSCLFGS